MMNGLGKPSPFFCFFLLIKCGIIIIGIEKNIYMFIELKWEIKKLA